MLNEKLMGLYLRNVSDLIAAAKCALADLEGIMPEFDHDGNRSHPGWETIEDLKKTIANFDGDSEEEDG